jgi:hypothetical protein
MGIGGETTRGNDDRRQSLLKKVEAMVKAGAEYRRWAAVILSSAKNDDSFRGMQIMISGFADDAGTDINENRRQHEQRQKHPPPDPVARRTPVSC